MRYGMKILQINSVVGQGSTGHIVMDLAEQQEKAKMQPIVAYGRGQGVPTSYPLIKIGRSKFNVYEHVFEARFLDNGGFASRQATRTFVKQIKEIQPDIVHLQNLHGYYLNVEILMRQLRQLNCKVVLTLHDCWPFSPQSAYIDFDQAGLLPDNVLDKKEYSEYPQTYAHRGRRLLQKKRAAFEQIKTENLEVVTPSHWLTNLARHSYFEKYHVQTIHNGIDLAKFRPDTTNYLEKKYHLDQKKIILGVANIWEPRKGLEYLNYLADWLDEQYQVVIVGKIPDKTHVSSKALQIKQTKDVQELSRIYAAADVFVNPTMAENFPTTNIESLASGTPVVTFKTGGSPESLTEFTGQVVPQGNSELLLAACQKINKNDQVVKACMTQAQGFDKNLSYRKYIKLYQEMKGGK